MTIHQSKGLGFDIVVLPRLAWTSRVGAHGRMGISQKRPSPRTWRDLAETEWLLRSPVRAISKIVAPLKACHEEFEAAEHYERFCLFYVAMTRAKRGLYLISPPLPADKKPGANPHGWLESALANCAEKVSGPVALSNQAFQVGTCFGKWAWFQELARVPPTPGSRAAAVPEPIRLPKSRLQRRQPSGEGAARLRPSQVFSISSRESRDYGTFVHAALQQVRDHQDLSALEKWRAVNCATPESWQVRALAEVDACLQNATIRAAMGRPEGGNTIWLEQPFEMVLDDAWVTGTFDRVVLENDRARIIDFKTDDVAAGPALAQCAEHYRPQMELYRRVLARLTALPLEKIDTVVVFTRLREVVKV
jgi:ATP-dependent helicase/nuclease subunit A